jgi:hypothetical protein
MLLRLLGEQGAAPPDEIRREEHGYKQHEKSDGEKEGSEDEERQRIYGSGLFFAGKEGD